MTINEMKNQPIRDVVYETLKKQILLGEIKPGTRIVETGFAQSMHISRTPLREALRRLEIDNLVKYVPYHGVIVCPFTLEDIREIYEIRNTMIMLLMPDTIKNATEKDISYMDAILSRMDVALANEDADTLAQLNHDFHGYMQRISGKKRILAVLDSQEEYVLRFSAITISGILKRSPAHQEHHTMLALLREKKADELLRLTRHHLEESKNTCLAAVQAMNKE